MKNLGALEYRPKNPKYTEHIWITIAKRQLQILNCEVVIMAGTTANLWNSVCGCFFLQLNARQMEIFDSKIIYGNVEGK